MNVPVIAGKWSKQGRGAAVSLEQDGIFISTGKDCPGWFGISQNIQHIVVPPNTSETEVKDLAKKFSNNITGSENCDVNLLQKYLMMVYPEKSYPSLTNLSFYEK